MGCGSRAGKMEMHSAGKPQVEQEYCVGCGKCQRIYFYTDETETNFSKRYLCKEHLSFKHNECGY